MYCSTRANTEKKVLIISRDFIPYFPSLGGVIRILKMAEFLTNEGITVYILSAGGESISYFGYKNLVDKMNITYFDDPLQKYFNKKAKFAFNMERRSHKKNQTTTLCKKVISDFIIPDLGVFFVNRYVQIGLKIIKKHGIKNIIVTSPPHSTQMIGFKLKKILKNNINYIIDYRDSWNTTNIFSKKLLLTQYLSKKLEYNILKTADKFIYVSTPILKKICNTYFNISGKAFLIMNGYDNNMFSDIYPNDSECHVESSSSSLKIGYFGSISSNKNSFRNAERLFNALIKFQKNNTQIKLIFFGEANIDKMWRDRLKGTMEIRGNVSHQRAIQLMRTMDVLMILHSQKNGADEVITGKLFDYLLAERPIFVVGPKDMEAIRLVKERQLGYYADIYNNEDILHTLNCIYQDWQNNRLISYSLNDVQDFSRQHQYYKLLDILK